MKFVNPFWLWALALVPVLYALVVFDEKRRQNQFARFADRKLWFYIAPEIDWIRRLHKGKILVIAFGFLFLALARPQWGTHEETVQVSGLDVMVALDVSNSMEVEDVVPSRLLKAKHVIRSIVSRLGGDRVGLIAFAYSSYVACPLTTDLDYLLDTVEIMSPKTIQNQGTDIGGAMETAWKALERGAEEVSAPHPGAPPSRVIILLSDGEDHEDQAIVEAVKMKSGNGKLYVLGLGTESGGPIPVKEVGQSQGFKRDRSGKPILSRFQPDFLTNLAAAAGGKYWTVTASEEEIQELLGDMGALDRSDYAERRYLVYEDRFQIPLLIAILLFLLEVSMPVRKKLSTIMILIVALNFVFLNFFNASPAFAENLLRKPAPLDIYLNNQKGIEAYKEGRLDDAQKEFGAAQALDPSQPELEFNQGVVQMQRGESERAIEAFKSSAKGALEKNDINLSGKALYNLGNALTKKGQIKDAIRSYLGAVQSAVQAKNTVLEGESRKNLQLLVDEIKQQKKDPKNDSQEDPKQDPKTNEKPGQKPNQKQKPDQSAEQKKAESLNEDVKNEGKGKEKKSDQQETKKSDSKQEFKSKKMDSQDADRVLNELKSRERDLQEKLNNQNARVQNHPKDW